MEQVQPFSVGNSGSALPLKVRLGRVWFQNRGFSPVPLFILLVLLKPNFHLSAVSVLLVSLGILAAEMLRIWAVGFAGSATRTRGETVPNLVHAGPYRFVRNPLYIANIVMYTLVGVLFGFSYLSLFIFVYSVLQYVLIVSFEEKILTDIFGEAYVRYTQGVARWWPSEGTYPSSSHLFSLKRALRSERSTFLTMGIMIVLLIVKNRFLNNF